MKRLSALLLALSLLLCGCAREPEPHEATTEPTAETMPVVEEQLELPNFGLYEANSTVEILTRGAVKKFPLTLSDVYAVTTMGEGLLLFSGVEETTLTYLTEDADPVTATLSGCRLLPDSATVRVTDEGISYYDSGSNAVVNLDRMFQETARVSLTAEIPSALVVSPDCERLYYFDASSLRCLEIKTGISRLLKECGFMIQEVRELHFDGTVLECYVSDGENAEALFVSAETGETLFMSWEIPVLDTAGERYFAEYREENMPRLFFGRRGDDDQCLTLRTEDAIVQPLLDLDGVLTYQSDETGTTLDYYDLEKSTRAGSARLAMIGTPWSLTADTERGLVWFLAPSMKDGSTGLYCWNPAVNPTEDAQSYVTPSYTALEPDSAGLEVCAQRANALGDQYGLRIRIWEDALLAVPDGYAFEGEYQVPVYEQYLPVLERALAQFPAGFFAALGEQSDNGRLTISLIRGAYGDNELGSLTAAEGVHFWCDGSAYVALVMGENQEQTIYHEVFHAIDSFVLTQTRAYDFWEELNPEGFQYDYSYITNQYREDYQYLEGVNRFFIDMYSMSYPKEDRARIMEYATMEGNEAYFTSDAMQAKLKTLCLGIREAFGLENHAAPLPWEQYLKESLVP